MQEGFYFHRNKVYYGCYDEKQVSGQVSIAALQQEHLPIHNQEDRAVRLWENHSLLEAEAADLQAMLLKMQSFMNISTGQEIDFAPVEERLNLPLPKELKLIYTAIHGQEEYFSSAEHFLSLDEIYVEQGILVFFKKKRTPVAGYDTASGRLAQYYKKEWQIERSSFCCYQFCIGRMLTIALENKPFYKTGRCKGKFVTTLNIEKELQQFCNEKYHLLSEFNVYGIGVLYSTEKLIAWIRSNGFYGDIHAGAMEEAHLTALCSYLGEITWK